MEQTLVVFKPDAVQRGIVGGIITRFEHVGLKIAALKMLRPDDAKYQSSTPRFVPPPNPRPISNMAVLPDHLKKLAS